MAEVVLDRRKFFSRMQLIYDAWESNTALSNVDSIVCCVGVNNDVLYSKSTALQWLFGYEMGDTLAVFCKKGIYFLSSKKKIEVLRQLENNKENQAVPPVTLFVREKSDKDKANFKTLIQHIRQSRNGSIIGEFSKDKFTGEFTEGWNEALQSENLERTDINAAFALLMSPKDDSEMELTKKASELTCTLFQKYLKEQIIEVVDGEKQVKHAKLSDGCESALKEKKYHPAGIDADHAELCYPPIIQSGGSYQLKFSVANDKRALHFGSVLCSLGVRYKSYCSNIVRTIMVDPSQELQDLYGLLLEIEEKILEALVPGMSVRDERRAKLSEVYEAAVSHLRAKKPELVEKFTKNVGFGTGIEFREGALLIQPKSNVVVQKAMVFNVNLGFADVENPTAKDDEGKTVAFFLGDTVLVNENGPATSLTEAAKKRVKSACLFFKNEEEIKQEDKDEGQLDILNTRNKRSVILQEQLRKKQSNEEKRKLHQKELAEQINETARERLAEARNQKPQEKMLKSTISYKSAKDIPNEPEVKQLKLFVDKKNECVILPIFGVATPFHISMIKNISQSVEGDFVYLRVNFFHPGTQLIRKDGGIFPKPEATFVKELTYRSSTLKEPGEVSAPSANLTTAFRLIKEVQKKFKTREAEEKEKEGIVKQDKLVLSTGKANPRLKDLYMKPNIVTKRVSGALEAHVNGFRYTSIRGDKLDIMYNNIKHAFFQPCDKEAIILLHFHLRHAILFGKKKHEDVQFYTEVGETITDLGKHQHMHDRDDIYQEQQERELRHRLNQVFKQFCEKVEKLSNQEVEFDTPFRDLGFTGVPFRQSVLLQPTSGCLVNLSEWPVFIATLEEVELVHFERVSFHHKNFDMVFVFKDYNKKVAMISSIPMNMLDHVKEWLDSCDIRYTEGIQSLNWQKIMKAIVDDPDEFFQNGGWNFLSSDSKDEDEVDDDDEDSEDDDAYAPTDEENSEEEDESDEEYESEASESSSGSGDSDGSGGSAESGKSWSELEEEAKKDDRLREIDDDERKRKAPPSKKAPPPAKRRK